ncbi:peptidylprolyl isomerase [Tenacibaculum sp. IB213877]|uniref:peptidylprolyl isomerase n=1 Tax=Tenacibaculum sp. IB213877 TaxID=3097351 RepID=UPI002A5AF4B9|nr:peptidylprolyl isomerase [Tenacibaculum sp. IB213877]MDY0779254.1 peptidylprolyl isomerase [Tenacibaculum sp. IB213877]
MKNSLFVIAFVFINFVALAQNEVLFTINKQPTTVGEFKRIYEKNLDLVDDEEAKSIDANLDLYINYKLKVNEAYKLKLDTVKSYQQELNSYKQQLMAPYLHDKEYQNKMVRQAYDRMKQEVRASHILLTFPKRGESVDTVAMIAKLNEARERIQNGEEFSKVAKEISEDPSAKMNGGDLGYFSAFKMVYPFEEAAYTTEVGQLSEPFKTRFGYHILKVTDKRPSKGEFEVAHIFNADRTNTGKAKIDSLYQKLESGIAFEEVAKKYSDDKSSGVKGGKLPRFGAGKMVAPFENVVLALKNEGDYSKPFKTQFGWHIVKLIKNHPVDTFENLQLELERKVKSGVLGNLSNKAMIAKLKTKYSIKVRDKVLQKALKKQVTEEVILTINDKKIPQNKFHAYVQNKGKTPTQKLFEEFTNAEVLVYFKENLEKTNLDFKYTYQEYKDGLLLFDLMQQKIWNKSMNDTIGLTNYYKANPSKYSKKLEEIKGKVVSDYQEFLEDNWIKDLREKNAVRIRKKALIKLKKTYNL